MEVKKDNMFTVTFDDYDILSGDENLINIKYNNDVQSSDKFTVKIVGSGLRGRQYTSYKGSATIYMRDLMNRVWTDDINDYFRNVFVMVDVLASDGSLHQFNWTYNVVRGFTDVNYNPSFGNIEVQIADIDSEEKYFYLYQKKPYVVTKWLNGNPMGRAINLHAGVNKIDITDIFPNGLIIRSDDNQDIYTSQYTPEYKVDNEDYVFSIRFDGEYCEEGSYTLRYLSQVGEIRYLTMRMFEKNTQKSTVITYEQNKDIIHGLHKELQKSSTSLSLICDNVPLNYIDYSMAIFSSPIVEVRNNSDFANHEWIPVTINGGGSLKYNKKSYQDLIIKLNLQTV